MTYDSGTARASYILDIEQPKRAAVELRALFQGIQKSTTGGLGGKPPTADEIKYAQALARTAEAQARIATAANKRIESEARAGRAVSQTALIDQKRATEAAKTAAADDRASVAALRRAQAEERAAKAAGGGGLGPTLPRSLENFGTAAIGQIVGGLGIAAVTSQVIQFGKEAFAAANSLEKTESTTAALAGSTARYNQVLAIAKAGQTSYGGSLEENLRGLGSLVNLSNRAGVELGKLDNISRRLAIVDPVQGIEGANIALKEFLSGDGAEAAVSLARRFELPKAALAALAKEGISAKDRLAGLDALLSQQGITSQVLTDRTKTTAATYDRLGAAAENAKVKVGGFLAELLKVPARNITLSLNLADDITSKKADLSATAVAGAQSFDQYKDSVRQANAELLTTFGTYRGNKATVDALTQSQFDYAKALQAQGVTAPEIITRLQGLRPVFDGITQAQDRYKATTITTNEGLAQFSAQILRVASSGAIGRAGVDSLNAAYLAGHLTTTQYQQALTGLELQQGRNTAAAQEEEREQRRLSGEYFKSSDAARQQAQALADAIGKTQTSAIESSKLADVQGRLASLGKDVYSGHITAAQGAAVLAQQYGLTSEEAEKLIRLQAIIAGNANAKKAEVAATGFRQNEINGEFQTQEQLNTSIQKQIGVDRARQEQLLRTGTAAQKIAVLQQRYNDALRQSGKNSKEAIDAQTALLAEQQSQEKAGGKGRVSAAQSTALQLQNLEQNSGLQLLKTQRENLERLRDQEADFTLRRVRNKEDEEEKIKGLLARGQRAAAARERADFEKQQRRDQEDFTIQRQRTLRNNAEATGDIGDKTDLRTSQIGARAGLRGGTATLGGSAPAELRGATGTDTGGARVIQVNMPMVLTTPDGQTIATITYPFIAARLDDDLSIELRGATPPGGNQSAVAGARP